MMDDGETSGGSGTAKRMREHDGGEESGEDRCKRSELETVADVGGSEADVGGSKSSMGAYDRRDVVGSRRGRGRGYVVGGRCMEREGARHNDGGIRPRVPARQKLVVRDVPAVLPGRAVAEEVWRAKGSVYGLSKADVVENARPERLVGGRGGEWIDWVLRLPTFLRQTLSEEGGGVMVAGAMRRVRRFVEVLQCRRCCGYGHGYAECREGQCCKKCGGPHEIRDCVGMVRRACVVCRRRGAREWDTRPGLGTARSIERNGRERRGESDSG